EEERRLLPERLLRFVPGLRFAARFEQTKSSVYTLRQTDLIQQLRMRMTEAFEVGRTSDRQLAGQVSLHNLIASNEVAVHDRGRRNTPFRRCCVRHLRRRRWVQRRHCD